MGRKCLQRCFRFDRCTTDETAPVHTVVAERSGLARRPESVGRGRSPCDDDRLWQTVCVRSFDCELGASSVEDLLSSRAMEISPRDRVRVCHENDAREAAIVQGCGPVLLATTRRVGRYRCGFIDRLPRACFPRSPLRPAGWSRRIGRTVLTTTASLGARRRFLRWVVQLEGTHSPPHRTKEGVWRNRCVKTRSFVDAARSIERLERNLAGPDVVSARARRVDRRCGDRTPWLPGWRTRSCTAS